MHKHTYTSKLKINFKTIHELLLKLTQILEYKPTYNQCLD